MNAEPGEIEAEFGFIGGVPEVAAESDAEAGADGVAVQCRDRGAGQVSNRQKEPIEAAHRVADPAPSSARRGGTQVRLLLKHDEITAR